MHADTPAFHAPLHVGSREPTGGDATHDLEFRILERSVTEVLSGYARTWPRLDPAGLASVDRVHLLTTRYAIWAALQDDLRWSPSDRPDLPNLVVTLEGPTKSTGSRTVTFPGEERPTDPLARATAPSGRLADTADALLPDDRARAVGRRDVDRARNEFGRPPLNFPLSDASIDQLRRGMLAVLTRWPGSFDDGRSLDFKGVVDRDGVQEFTMARLSGLFALTADVFASHGFNRRKIADRSSFTEEFEFLLSDRIPAAPRAYGRLLDHLHADLLRWVEQVGSVTLPWGALILVDGEVLMEVGAPPPAVANPGPKLRRLR